LVGIFGFLFIKDNREEDDLSDDDNVVTRSVFVIGDEERSLELDPRAHLKFWDFYKNPKSSDSIFWGTGLYRSLDDVTVFKILRTLRERYSEIDDDMAQHVLDDHIFRCEKAV